MILVDASVWIDHIRSPIARLVELLDAGLVIAHPLVVGELAMGSIAGRAGFLATLDLLPMATEAEHPEVRGFIETHKLFSRGIGYIDIHLLAACLLTPQTILWTRDKRLRQIAEEFDLAYPDHTERD